jgi:hypothetical protein
LTTCYKKYQFKSQKEEIKKKIEAEYAALQRQMGPDGGWSYYDFCKNTSMAFLTAAILVHMKDAEKAGIPIPDQTFQRALSCLKGHDQNNGVWMYRTTVPQTVEGSQGRACVCEMALAAAGVGNKQRIQLAVENFFKYRHILAALKGKQGTHDYSKGGTAPYYYLYGHYWCARAIKQLDKSVQNGYLDKLRGIILQDQENDGCVWDFPIPKHHKEYGSAFGALIMYQIATLENPNAGPKLNQGK